MDMDERQNLDRMFHPKAIAVFGAVLDPGKYGRMNIMSLLQYGYGGKIYPIHPDGGEACGLKVYRTLMEVEGRVDLAKVCVPASMVTQVLRDCLQRGVAGAEIQSSGFAETGDPGDAELQEEIVRISQKGIRIMGPNCFGTYCPKSRITLPPGFDFSKESGPVALISQSGGVVVDFAQEARMAGISISKAFSFGNGCDLDAAKLLDYLLEDQDTGYVGAYIEGVADGRKFMKALQALAVKKPTLIWKGGVTPAGKRSVQSHTGSLSGDAQVWQGLLTQAGALMVEGLEELVETMTALVHLRRTGRNIAIVGPSGAVGVFSSDLAYRWGLKLPSFRPETQKKLKEWFKTPGNSLINPVDTGSPILDLKILVPVMEEVLAREPVDCLIVVLQFHQLGVLRRMVSLIEGLPVPVLGEYLEGLLQASLQIKRHTGKDIVVAFHNRANLPTDLDIEGTCRSFRLRYHAEGVPVYSSTERALRAIRNRANLKI
jgi:acyl-CoA synthetase (NDP forming)